jgi:hypothetical protein
MNLMQPSGYSPYQHKENRKKLSIRLPRLSWGVKKWLLIILGIILGIFLIFYLCMGQLRFFANNYLRLAFLHKDYLIVLQNNYEERPSGGFVTGYGEVSATMGFPGDISFHNSYEIDTDTYVMPPYPHEEMLKNEWYEGYTFRDANWNPDFPGSAETLIDFYQKKFPEKDVDGIIVVNFNVIENLAEKLGGIELDGQKLDKENLFKAITDTVNDVDRHNEKALLDRKDILSEMAAKLIPKAKWHPFKTKSVITEALENKDIFFWFKSKGLQRKVQKKGWANHLELPPASDFLHVNIANLGSKKADRYLIKEVYHHVNIRKEIPEVTTEITLRYPGAKNNYADDYKGYLRVYIPATAVVQSDLLGAAEEKDGDFKVLSTELILPTGSKTTVSYTYQLPRTLLPDNEYDLRLVKQSGDSKRYTLTVESHDDSAMTSDDFETRENKAIWQGMLESDRDFHLELLPDHSPPYPIEQVFESLNTVSIYWNEPIDPSTGNDALNYEIADDNRQNPEVTDEVKVVYAEVIDASVSRLELEGVTQQNLERYGITLKNIRDQAGNVIDPNPKNITAIQRIIEKEEEETPGAELPAPL